MQQDCFTLNSSQAGGRLSSLRHRTINELAENFEGLPDSISRYDLLVLVKRAGKLAGFSARMIMLLDYYMAFTRDIDWEQGGRPIIYQCLSKTALDLGVTERQIQRLEKQLHKAGALTWHDSGNHRRYGQRCKRTGRILFAYGVDLAPLANLKDTLEDLLHKKQLTDNAWLETKRQISFYRRKIKALMSEAGQGSLPFEAEYSKMNMAIRTYMKLSDLRDLLARHRDLYQRLEETLEQPQKSHKSHENETTMTQKQSPCDVKKVVSKESFTHKPSNKLDSEKIFSEMSKRTGGPLKERRALSDRQILERAGLQHITLPDCLRIASDVLKEYLPLEVNQTGWSELIEAAYRRKGHLNISQSSWADACQILGRSGAAICVILTDRAYLREHEPVRKPAAYFAAMIRRARAGELKLDQSMRLKGER
jgi:hypothetical protein